MLLPGLPAAGLGPAACPQAGRRRPCPALDSAVLRLPLDFYPENWGALRVLHGLPVPPQLAVHAPRPGFIDSNPDPHTPLDSLDFRAADADSCPPHRALATRGRPCEPRFLEDGRD